MADNKLKRIDELKAKIDQFRPLDKSLLKQIREYFRIGLTYSSNALEGNSLTETETKVVIEDGITIGGKPLKDHYEAIGHSEAYDLLYRLARSKEITEKHIKDLHRVFERFYQVEGHTTRRHGGMGLGLAVAKVMIEMHGGQIWAESVEGRGSNFSFLLPTRP